MTKQNFVTLQTHQLLGRPYYSLSVGFMELHFDRLHYLVHCYAVWDAAINLAFTPRQGHQLESPPRQQVSLWSQNYRVTPFPIRKRFPQWVCLGATTVFNLQHQHRERETVLILRVRGGCYRSGIDTRTEKSLQPATRNI